MMVKKLAALSAILFVSGCAVVSKQASAPQVAERIQSSKTALEFGKCSATAMGRDLQENDDGIYILMENGVYIRARWDFVATLRGSEAELRGPLDYDAEIKEVIECSTEN